MQTFHFKETIYTILSFCLDYVNLALTPLPALLHTYKEQCFQAVPQHVVTWNNPPSLIHLPNMSCVICHMPCVMYHVSNIMVNFK